MKILKIFILRAIECIILIAMFLTWAICVLFHLLCSIFRIPLIVFSYVYNKVKILFDYDIEDDEDAIKTIADVWYEIEADFSRVFS